MNDPAKKQPWGLTAELWERKYRNRKLWLLSDAICLVFGIHPQYGHEVHEGPQRRRVEQGEIPRVEGLSPFAPWFCQLNAQELGFDPEPLKLLWHSACESIRAEELWAEHKDAAPHNLTVRARDVIVWARGEGITIPEALADIPELTKPLENPPYRLTSAQMGIVLQCTRNVNLEDVESMIARRMLSKDFNEEEYVRHFLRSTVRLTDYGIEALSRYLNKPAPVEHAPAPKTLTKAKRKQPSFTGLPCSQLEIIVSPKGLTIKRTGQRGTGTTYDLKELSLEVSATRRGDVMRWLSEIAINKTENATTFKVSGANHTLKSNFNKRFRAVTEVTDNLLTSDGAKLSATAGQMLIEGHSTRVE